jgi:hypothetical protein
LPISSEDDDSRRGIEPMINRYSCGGVRHFSRTIIAAPIRLATSFSRESTPSWRRCRLLSATVVGGGANADRALDGDAHRHALEIGLSA